jgi:transposase InsO family protein
MAHGKAKLTIEGRRLLVHRVLVDGWSPAAAAEAQGVHRSTAYKWLRRFAAEGDRGLADRSSRPHRCPHRISPAREAAILNRRRLTLEGPHRIGWALGESRSTVWRVLRRNHMPRLCDLDRPTGRPVRYQRERPGELVHIDIKKQARIPEGGGWRIHGRDTSNGARHKKGLGYDYLHAAVDDRTRIAYVEVHDDEQQDTAAGFLERATSWFADHGITIERVLTDNGSCYRSQLWRRTCQQLQIAPKRTRPYRPQTNGKVERFNQTLKREWAWAYAWTSNHQRTQSLAEWVHVYNHHRPHTAHQGGAPMSLVDNLPRKHS